MKRVDLTDTLLGAKIISYQDKGYVVSVQDCFFGDNGKGKIADADIQCLRI